MTRRGAVFNVDRTMLQGRLYLKRLTEIIILLHRYIGIPMGVIILLWFASGIVMIYTRGMPARSPERSLELMSTLPVEQIRLTPAEALRRNDLYYQPQRLTLEALLLRPVYRVGDTTVFADDGELFDGADEDSGRDIVAIAFEVPTRRVNFEGKILEPDQWTITERNYLPALKYTLDDDAATDVYVSIDSGRIFLVTDRSSRFLAWIGAIPHWIYFTALRNNQPAWFWTIVVLSSMGCLLTVLGLILAFTQFRVSKPFNLNDSIRYRGLMRWHYLSGAVFGLLALTWLFSGLLSMDPFDWNRQDGLHVDEAELNWGVPLTQSINLDALATVPTGAVEIEAKNVLGQLRFIVHRVGSVRTVIDPISANRTSASAEIGEVVSRLEEATGFGATHVEWISDYDNYYYDRDQHQPLPVVKAMLDDPDATWVYIDPSSGQIVRQVDSLSRLDRWLFNGLHSLDFSFWYDKRPLWDIAVIVLSFGGLTTSGFGIWLGFRRVRRWVARRPP